jgi:hypothetical protein
MTRPPLDVEANRHRVRQLRAQLVGIAAVMLAINIWAAAAGVPAPMVWFLGFGLGVTAAAAYAAVILTRRW